MNKAIYILLTFIAVNLTPTYGQNINDINSHKFIEISSPYSRDYLWAKKEIDKQFKNSSQIELANKSSKANDILKIEIISISQSFIQINMNSPRSQTDSSVETYTSLRNIGAQKHINTFVDYFLNKYSYNGYLAKDGDYKKIAMEDILFELENNTLDKIEGLYNYYILHRPLNTEEFTNLYPDILMQRAIIKDHHQLDVYNVLKFEEEKPTDVTIKYAEVYKSKLQGFKYKNYPYSIKGQGNFIIEFIDENNFICSFNNETGSYKYVYEKKYPLDNQNSSQSVESDWIGNGTGFFINNQGLIATNSHVVQEAKEIAIEMTMNGEKKSLPVELVCSDIKNDIAILKITNYENLIELPFKIDERIAEVSEEVYTLGYPMALNGMGKEVKYTVGVISSTSGLNNNLSHYQISTPIQGGNSGGPLFDINDNVIGLISSKLVSTEIENVGYAIKSIYLTTLAKTAGISLSTESSLNNNTSKAEKIKILDDYVVLIKVK